MATKKSVAKPAKAVAKKAVVKKAVAKKVPVKKVAAKPAAKKSAPTHEEISKLAYKFYQERGHHHSGHEGHDWARAVAELHGKS